MKAVLLSTLLCTVASADRICRMNGFGCSTPFPPGHKYMGPGWWAVGTEDKGTYIKSVSTLLQIPDLPQGVNGIMAINPAMENTPVNDWSDSNPSSQTVQTIIGSFVYKYCDTSADAPEHQWCAFTSFYDKSKATTQESGPTVMVKKGQWIQIDYNYTPKPGVDASGAKTAGTVDQWLTIDGNSVSHLQTTVTEAPRQWFPKSECQCGGSGNMPGHIYHDTKIVLADARPQWDWTCRNTAATDSKGYTKDGGTTWQWDTIWMGGGVCINNSDECTGFGT